MYARDKSLAFENKKDLRNSLLGRDSAVAASHTHTAVAGLVVERALLAIGMP